MSREQAYFKQIDLSKQKSISSKKLKDLITTAIKRKIALMNDTKSGIVIDTLHDQAHELLLFGKYQLCLYTDTENDYIYNKICQATDKRLEELKNDQI